MVIRDSKTFSSSRAIQRRSQVGAALWQGGRPSLPAHRTVIPSHHRRRRARPGGSWAVESARCVGGLRRPDYGKAFEYRLNAVVKREAFDHRLHNHLIVVMIDASEMRSRLMIHGLDHAGAQRQS
jgi:hypothetical protein